MAGSGSVRTCSVTTTWFLLLILGSRLIAGSLSNSLSVLLILVNCPVKDIIVLETLADEEIAEDLAKVGVIRFVVKAERTRVVEVDGELVREATAKDFSWSGHLLLHDTVVLLLLRGSLETLPR